MTNTQFRPPDIVGQKRHLGTIRGSLDTAGRCASAVSGQVIPQDPLSLGSPQKQALERSDNKEATGAQSF